MSEKNSKKVMITFNKGSSKSEKNLELILDRVNDREPDAINEYRSPLEEQKIEAAVSLLKANPKLRAFVEVSSKGNGGIEVQLDDKIRESDIKMLKSVGIIEYTGIDNEKQRESHQEADNKEKDNPELDRIDEEVDNQEQKEEDKAIDNPAEMEYSNDKENDINTKKEQDEKIEEQRNDNNPEKEELADDIDKPIGKDNKSFRERLIEQVKGMKDLDRVRDPNGTATLKDSIIRAYELAGDANQLSNPEYLKNFMENDSATKGLGFETKSFGDFHKSMLMNTYVSYTIENDAEMTEDGNQIGVANFPETIDNMPQWLKSQYNQEITKYIERAINKVASEHSSYEALIILNPIDDIAEKGLEEAERNSNSNMKRAYIKYLASDFKANAKREFATGEQNLDVNIKVGDVDWSNPRIRKDMINLINKTDKEAYNQNIEQLIKNISFDVVVYSQEDVQELEAMCKDLKDLKVTKDITVVVATDDPRVQNDVDKIVDRNDGIERDTYEEEKIKTEQMLTDAITAGVGVAMGVAFGKELLDEVANDSKDESNIAKNMELNHDQKMAIIMTDAMKNEKLMQEVAMHGDNPVEYMAALTQEMLEIEEEEQAREMYYRDSGYDDSDAN